MDLLSILPSRYIDIIFSKLSKKIGRNLTNDDKFKIIKMISVEEFKHDSNVSDILNLILNKLLNIFKNYETDNNDVNDYNEPEQKNIKTLLKNLQADIDKNDDVVNLNMGVRSLSQTQLSKNINISKIFGTDNLKLIQRIINPRSIIKRQYVSLNSVNRRIDLDTTNTSTWFYTPDGFIDNGITTTLRFKNIIGMRINNIAYDSFYSQRSRLYNLLIKEFSAQSFNAHENRKFHFMFQDSLYITPIPAGSVNSNRQLRILNGGRYKFYKPITELNSLTLSFGNVTKEMPFPLSRRYIRAATILKSNPVQLITTSTIEKYESGDIVRFVNFTTANPITDQNLIAEVNRDSGHAITKITNSKFSIPIDFTGLTFPALKVFQVVNETRNININLEFYYIS